RPRARRPACARRRPRRARGQVGRLPRRGRGEPVRIVSVMTSRTRGGAEHAAVWLLDALAGRGHDVRLLTSHPDLTAGRPIVARPVALGPKLSARSWPPPPPISPPLPPRPPPPPAR